MKQTIFCLMVVFTLVLTACQLKQTTTITDPNPNAVSMNTHISIFEIPVLDLPRATQFYQAILSIKIEVMEAEGFQIGLFPYENQTIFGTLIKGEGYLPSSNGVTIYLNAGDDLQQVLDKVEPNGGKIIIPKMAHADGSGYFAVFHDTEGNKLGLHSPQ